MNSSSCYYLYFRAQGAKPHFALNAIELSLEKPSPEGEGWVRGNKNKEKTHFNPPHPDLLPQ